MTSNNLFCFRSFQSRELIVIIFLTQAFGVAEQSSAAVCSRSGSLTKHSYIIDNGILALEKDHDKGYKVLLPDFGYSSSTSFSSDDRVTLKAVPSGPVHEERKWQHTPDITHEAVSASDAFRNGKYSCKGSAAITRQGRTKGAQNKRAYMIEQTDSALSDPESTSSIVHIQNWWHMLKLFMLFVQRHGHTCVPTAGKNCQDASLGR
jgi:hypothetical protein